MRKLTTEEFIQKAKDIHSNKYDYSLVEYKTNGQKVKIICTEHGIFKQSPGSHMKGQNCRKCSDNKRSSNTEKFIKKAINKHGNKYDYSSVNYKRRKDNIKIICSYHGIFYQKPYLHLKGQGCSKCTIEKNAESRKHDIEKFIQKSKNIHGDGYDYSLVNYKNAKTKVKIICPEHGVFEQMPYSHNYGNGCPNCDTNRLTTEEFIQRAKDTHGNKYNYSMSEYINNREKIKIICPDHGEFEQNAGNHLISGCFKCGKYNLCENLTEECLSKIFDSEIIREKKFEDCSYKRLLSFDFWIPEENLLVEYDGKQHYEPIEFFGGKEEFLATQKRDEIKNNYCKENNINLIRIPYTQNDSTKILKFLSDKLELTS